LFKIALSVAGSDSAAGAGIQADLKSFSALGVYGCTAITAITAQNTSEVSEIFDMSPEIIRKQIEAITTDMHLDAVKIGMVHSKAVVQTVYKALRGCKAPIVLDPILASATGSKLIDDNAFEHFKSHLIPISTVITPNLMEAERLTDLQIKTVQDSINAARIIRKLGPKNVVIKGGHANSEHATDILCINNGGIVRISNRRIKVPPIHGSGCNFSAALTAFLARGFGLIEAFKSANLYVHESILNGFRPGRGLLVINPVYRIYEYASRYEVLNKLQQALIEIESINNFSELIPETQSNIVYAMPNAKHVHDVAGVKGRVIRIGKIVRAASTLEFGASTHVASAVIEYMKYNPCMRSSMNIKLDRKILRICDSLFHIASYCRRLEPEYVKRKEGKSIGWGISNALKNNPRAEIIYHRGDIGKEPMILVFSEDPITVIDKVKKILRRY
jgi:hydroxymethylpyrimidine kinase / phosphomethylpyrimidine kinase / thiamine-phosphate diphosphorylase